MALFHLTAAESKAWQMMKRGEDTGLSTAEQQRITQKACAPAIFAYAPKPAYFQESAEIKKWWEAQ